MAQGSAHALPLHRARMMCGSAMITGNHEIMICTKMGIGGERRRTVTDVDAKREALRQVAAQLQASGDFDGIDMDRDTVSIMIPTSDNSYDTLSLSLGDSDELAISASSCRDGFPVDSSHLTGPSSCDLNDLDSVMQTVGSYAEQSTQQRDAIEAQAAREAELQAAAEAEEGEEAEEE